MITNLAIGLAWVLYWEASTCTREEMREVATTFWCRASSRPGSFDDMDLFYVISAPAQYSCVRDRLREPVGRLIPGDADPMWKYAIQLGAALVQGARTGDPNWWKMPHGRLTHYYLRSMRDPPTWSYSLKNIVDMPKHRFGLLP